MIGEKGSSSHKCATSRLQTHIAIAIAIAIALLPQIGVARFEHGLGALEHCAFVAQILRVVQGVFSRKD